MMAANRNTLWASIIAHELALGGLKAVSMAPGSRSTPLTLAFAKRPEIDVYVHGDERSAAFFALGLAQASDRPVAVLCTSGTATVNVHPAVIEAFYAQLPLLVLTADRPHEQRYSGANQTIDQVKLYGDHVLWAVDVALPEANPPDRVLRSLRTLAGRALFVANGLRKGPVHLNFPFRKPLEPTPVEGDAPLQANAPGVTGRGGVAHTRFSEGKLQLTGDQLERFKGFCESASQGLIVCGPRCPKGGFPEAVVDLSKALGYPILADGLSGVRFGPHVGRESVLGAHETLLKAGVLSDPEVVVRFGTMPLSKQLSQALERWAPLPQLAVSGDGLWSDAVHSLSELLWADPEHACRALVDVLDDPVPKKPEWLARWQAAEQLCWQILGSLCERQFCEEVVVRDVVSLLPRGGSLFVSNSLPVRHLDQFVPPDPKPIQVFANRGASGIDGIVSSAAGVSAARRAPTVLLTGDLAFYHDLNGLLALKRYDLKLVIVLLNNDGGAIFRRLPVAQFEPPFSKLFVTPHGLDFSHAARLYGLTYAQTTSREAFADTYRRALESEGSALIEVPFDGKSTHQNYQEMLEKAVNGLSAV